MDHFAGLDVSVKETSICIVDDAGKIVREVKVASDPEALFRGRVWADVLQVSIGRGRSERQNITLRRRDDAGDALRGSSEHAAFEEMVLAQGLGDADRQAPWDEKGDRGAGAPVGCDHAPHMG